MAPLFRQDLQLATLGDTLQMKLRDVDAQLEQNSREMESGRKRRDDIAYLKDERRILAAQGLQAAREIQEWRGRQALWSNIYWSLFALAHVVLLPLALWALAAASVPGPATRSRTTATPRKRSPRAPRNSPPKLIEGMQP